MTSLSPSEYQNQEAMVGQAMEECVPEQLTDLDVKLGELVHILSKNPDGRWRVFVIRRQVRTNVWTYLEHSLTHMNRH